MKKITDLKLENKKVIIRCDFNVPIKDGKIVDDTRIKMSLDTINYCLKRNCKIILLSHLGRVKEKKDLNKTLKPVAERLEKLLNKKVLFINETRGKKLDKAVKDMECGDIILVENTRFEDLNGNLESGNDKKLAKYWASLGDVFINDAFGTIHRSHASNVGIEKKLKSAVGLLVEKELDKLSELNNPKKPFVIVLGGAKVKDKIGVIENLVEKADHILIGGGMAFTFLQSEGFNVGNSIVDYDSLDFCSNILEKYPEKILLPIDVKTSTEFSNQLVARTKLVSDISDNDIGMDIGNKTVELYEEYLKKAKVVLWNGPLGVYEFSKYKKSTNDILKFLVDNKIKTILGGGDIVAAATTAKLTDKIYHVSTGGGATLEYLEGKKLPGLENIK